MPQADQARKKAEIIAWIKQPTTQQFLEILNAEYRGLEKQEPDFSTDAWPYRQASIVGQRQLINKLRSLFEIEGKDN